MLWAQAVYLGILIVMALSAASPDRGRKPGLIQGVWPGVIVFLFLGGWAYLAGAFDKLLPSAWDG